MDILLRNRLKITIGVVTLKNVRYLGKAGLIKSRSNIRRLIMEPIIPIQFLKGVESIFFRFLMKRNKDITSNNSQSQERLMARSCLAL